ncbi:hypothetical protein [Bradyrhizobium sp. RDM4]|uniref:hypothetical protein n=1 Tax=Bradyrhizobium sp. RDM4 TaxID=3378765 RepID=UPI0038FCD92D
MSLQRAKKPYSTAVPFRRGLALLMVPVFFLAVQRALGGDREKAEEAEMYGPPAPANL